MISGVMTRRHNVTRSPRKGRQRSYTWISLLVVLLALGAWHFVVSRYVRPLYFPSTTATLEALDRLGTTYLSAAWATTYRVMVGLVLGVLVGVATGICMHASRVFAALLDPFVEVLRPIPALALIPFFILWFGLGDLGKILLIALGGFVVMVVTTFEALSHVSPVYLRAARTLGAGRPRLYRTVYLPAILPSFWSGVRVSAAMSFGLGIAAEFMGAQRGLGYLILLARRTLQTEVMLLGVLGIGLLSFAVDRLIRVAARRTTRWAAIQ